MNSNFKFFLFIVILSFSLLFFASYIASYLGIILMFILLLMLSFFIYKNMDKLILSFYKTYELDKSNHINIIVNNLANKANIKKPKLYFLDLDHINVFSCGTSKNKSLIAISKKTLDLLNTNEIEAVLAHEISHIKNNDILLNSFIAIFSSSITYLSRLLKEKKLFFNKKFSNFIFLLLTIILYPLASIFIKIFISKSREFIADKQAKELLGDSSFLSSALLKINNFNLKKEDVFLRPEMAHLFIYNPLSNIDLINLFNTHPSIKDRVDKLLYTN